MPIDFEDAVERCKKLIRSGLTSGMAPSLDGKEMLVSMPIPGFRKNIGANMIRKEPEELIAWAREDGEGYEVAKLAVAFQLERGDPLPDVVQKWLIQDLNGEIEKPPEKTGRKKKEWFDILVWIAIQSRVNDGMTATRNDVSPPTSACDAVAEALVALGLSPRNYAGVKRIWMQMEQKHLPSVKRTSSVVQKQT